MTIPTDLLARLRAVLTAAEAMTPGPWVQGSVSGRCHRHKTPHPGARGPDPCVYEYSIDARDEWSRSQVSVAPDITLIGTDDSGPVLREKNARGIVALRNATADLAALLALVEAPAPLTVGAALADPRVQDGSHVAEYSGEHDVAEYRQTRVDAGGFRIWSRWRLADRWGPWRDNGNTALDGCDVRKPCRLAPLADADCDPNDRGPL